MSSFKSNETKRHAETTVNKLISSYLNTSSQLISNNKDSNNKNEAITGGFQQHRLNSKKSGAAKIHQLSKDFKKLRENKTSLHKERLRQRKTRSKEIKKNLKIKSKLDTLVALNLKDTSNNSKAQEIKDSLISKNIKNLKSWELGDEDAEEYKELEKELIDLKYANQNRKKVRRAKQVKKMEFQEKVKKGYVSMPGLTPGLAPVGDSDDDESSDEDSGAGLNGFKDDFDQYN